MRPNAYLLCSFLAAFVVGCASSLPFGPGRPEAYSVVELPRPNSCEFSFAEAEARKSEIFALAQTPMLPGHRQGNAFNVHITRKDEIVIYDNFPWREGRMTVGEVRKMLETEDFSHDPFGGEPWHILVTSERDPKRSRTLPLLTEVLFHPYIQIHYLGPANECVEPTAGCAFCFDLESLAGGGSRWR
jgi:hypothetical protein